MKCLICHIDIDEINAKEKVDCPNHHSVHIKCLMEWMTHSKNCPLCSTPYSQGVLNGFQDQFDKKEKETQDALKKEKDIEEKQKMIELADKMLFKKFIETVEMLASKERYVDALDKLDAIKGQYADENKHLLMFLKGKMNFLRGRHDMAINHLFKLVKEKFDYPDAFLYLGKAYKEIGLDDKAQWAFDRIPKE